MFKLLSKSNRIDITRIKHYENNPAEMKVPKQYF